MRHVGFGFGYAALTGWMVYRVLSPARAVWRGDASRVPAVPRIRPQARTYLLFALWFTMLFGGTGLAMFSAALDALVGPFGVLEVISVCGFGLFFAGLALLPLHLFAYCCNRPRLLITPAWRHEDGPLTAIWRRLRRRLAGSA